MSPEEIHAFGIETVRGQLEKEGYEVLSCNSDLNVNPQIIAKKGDTLNLIAVRTACYPNKGELPPDIAGKMIEYAESKNALAYFASVGIANSSGQDQEGMSQPVRGVGFYIAYEGLLLLTRQSQVRLAERNDYFEYEHQVASVFARCWNRLNFDELEKYLSNEVIYESQEVLKALSGKSEVLDYLRGKAETIRKSGPDHRVFAELAKMIRIYVHRPCVLLAQGNPSDKTVLVLFETAEARIKRIDLCTVVPTPQDAQGTGEYPS